METGRPVQSSVWHPMYSIPESGNCSLVRGHADRPLRLPPQRAQLWPVQVAVLRVQCPQSPVQPADQPGGHPRWPHAVHQSAGSPQQRSHHHHTWSASQRRGEPRAHGAGIERVAAAVGMDTTSYGTGQCWWVRVGVCMWVWVDGWVSVPCVCRGGGRGCVCVCVCKCVCVCVCVCACVYVCMYVAAGMCVCLQLCVCVLNVCVFVCMCMSVCVLSCEYLFLVHGCEFEYFLFQYSWKLLNPTDPHKNKECPPEAEEYERVSKQLREVWCSYFLLICVMLLCIKTYLFVLCYCMQKHRVPIWSRRMVWEGK